MTDIEFKFTRLLHVIHDGVEFDVTVEIGGIEKIDDSTFLCRFKLPVIGSDRGHVYGVDAIHAFELGLRTIRTVITEFLRKGSVEI